jgi:hypothetical protein
MQFTPIFPDDATFRVGFEAGTLVSSIRPFHEVPHIYSLQLSDTDVVAGKDSYTVAIRGLHHPTHVTIRYNLNDGPDDTFEVILNANGEQVLPVSSDTPRGTYRFSAFTIANSEEWVACDATIVVR